MAWPLYLQPAVIIITVQTCTFIFDRCEAKILALSLICSHNIVLMKALLCWPGGIFSVEPMWPTKIWVNSRWWVEYKPHAQKHSGSRCCSVPGCGSVKSRCTQIYLLTSKHRFSSHSLFRCHIREKRHDWGIANMAWNADIFSGQSWMWIVWFQPR